MAKDIIPLVTPNSGSYNVNDDEDITIMYHNVSPRKTGSQEYSLSVRPSLGTVTTTASIDDNSRGRGVADFQGYDLFIVNDDTLYYSGGSTEIHSTQAFDKELLASFVHYSQAGSPRLVLVNAGATSTAGTSDGSVWFMTDTTSAPTQITDVDMPGNNGQSLIRGGVSLDGFFFVGDIDGKIHNCAVDALTTWAALDFLTAEREADVGVYLGKHRDHVVYIGTGSIEFFYNAANTSGSPLSRRNDIYYNVGCYHPNTVLELGDKIYFIGRNADGDSGLYVLDNFSLAKVSDNTIISNYIKGLEYAEPDISAATNLQQDVYLAPFNSADNGQFLILTMPNNGTFAMHLETGVWAKWYLGGTPDNNGGITDWEDPKIFPLTASLNRPGANSVEPNRYLLLNGLVSSEFIPTGVNVYSNNSYDVSAEIDGSPEDGSHIAFNNDGTSMYVSNNNSEIFQYTLATAYNVGTSTYASKTIDLSAQLAISVYMDIALSSDGTKLFALESGQPHTLYMYNLSVAWDISTATYSNDSFSMQSEFGTNGSGNFVFNSTGTKLYALHVFSVYKVHQYDLSTAWDITSAAYSTKAYDYSAIMTTSAFGLAMANDDSTFYIGDDGATNLIREFSMSNSSDITSTTATGINLDFSGEMGSIIGIQKTINGNLYIMENAIPATIYQYGSDENEPQEFGGLLNGVDNPSYVAYSRPWDKNTNERKRISCTRVLHYADGRTNSTPSPLIIDWINTDNYTTAGITPAAFTGTRTVDLAGYRARLYRGGVTRQRIFKLGFNGTKTQIVKGIELDFDPLRG